MRRPGVPQRLGRQCDYRVAGAGQEISAPALPTRHRARLEIQLVELEAHRCAEDR